MTKASIAARGRSALVGLMALTVVAAVVLTGTTPSGAASRPAMVKDGGSTAPGTLIASEPVTASGVDGTAYLVEYWSKTVPKNKPVKVTGLVFVPPGTAPAGGWPVVTWAHPTDGTNKFCAPSLDPSTDVPNINNLLGQGWEVTATDYQGEANSSILPKSPGILPYLVGTSAARNTLDIVKAALQLPAADASANYVVWGWSEGGQTAMFASQIAASYAPTLNLEGVLAMAPPSQNSTLIEYAETTSNWPLAFLAVGGFNSAYGNKLAPTSELLTAKGKSDLKLLKTKCLDTVGLVLLDQGFSKVFKIAAGSPLPAKWNTLADLNDPASFTAASPAPIVIAGGSDDALVLPSTTAALASQLCALSPPQNLERWLYAGLTHDNIDATATINDYVQWTADRFAGDPSPGYYTPTGMGANTPTVTNLCG
jgi:hypothetical protein